MKQYRNDFPIFKRNSELVYLDSAATSQKPQQVLDAVSDFYENYNSNIHRGIYPIAEKATARVEEVREIVAKFLNASSSDEILFTHGTTESMNLVMYSWGRENILKGDIVLSTVAEHHANFVPWQFLAKEKHATFIAMDILDDGSIDLKKYEKELRNAKLFALSYVSSVLGKINPIPQIVKDIRKVNKNILIVVDGAQAVPFMQVDVQKLDCDFFSLSGHKVFAETGVGVLYGKKKILDTMQPFLFGGNMIQQVSIKETIFAPSPTRFEAGTLDIAGIISLGAAIEYLSKIGLDAIEAYERELVRYALNSLQAIEDISIVGPTDPRERASIVTFSIKKIHPHDIAQMLGDRNICIRAGHHCAMPLHTRLGIPASARISVSLYNTKEDIDKLVERLHYIQKVFNS